MKKFLKTEGENVSLVLRMPKALHELLRISAKERGVSLNRLMVELLRFHSKPFCPQPGCVCEGSLDHGIEPGKCA